jgi:hypothetical protein
VKYNEIIMAPQKTKQKSAKKGRQSGVKKNVTKVVTSISNVGSLLIVVQPYSNWKKPSVTTESEDGSHSGTPSSSNNTELRTKSGEILPKPVSASMAMARTTAQTCKQFFKLTSEQFQQQRRYIRS